MDTNFVPGLQLVRVDRCQVSSSASENSSTKRNLRKRKQPVASHRRVTPSRVTARFSTNTAKATRPGKQKRIASPATSLSPRSLVKQKPEKARTKKKTQTCARSDVSTGKSRVKTDKGKISKGKISKDKISKPKIIKAKISKAKNSTKASMKGHRAAPASGSMSKPSSSSVSAKKVTPAPQRQKQSRGTGSSCTSLPPKKRNPTDRDLDKAITQFSQAHRQQLQANKDQPPVKELLRSAARLLVTLENRKIRLSLGRSTPREPALFAILKNKVITTDAVFISTFFYKANVFFSAVDQKKIGSTGCLSGMLSCDRIIKDFVNEKDENIQAVASSSHLESIARMYLHHGWPKSSELTEMFGWDCWQFNGKFCPVLLQAYSKVFHSCGLPAKPDVENFRNNDRWQIHGRLSPEILQAFVAGTINMYPNKLKADLLKQSFKRWVPPDKQSAYLKLANKLFADSALPLPATLENFQEVFRQQFNNLCKYPAAMDSDLEKYDGMKLFALFRSAPPKCRLNVHKFQYFLTAHRESKYQALESLQSILVHHGGQGVVLWLQMLKKRPYSRKAITEVLTMPVPTNQAGYVMNHLPQSQWLGYLELFRDKRHWPNVQQWQKLAPVRQRLKNRFSWPLARRMMLEILWPLGEKDRCYYSDHLDDIIKTVPSMAQLHLIFRTLGANNTKHFMDASIKWQWSSNKTDETFLVTLDKLLVGLLIAGHYLEGHEDIPALCFAKRTAVNQGHSVKIEGCPAQGDERLRHFVVAILTELRQTDYRFRNQQLTIIKADNQPLVLPKPEFSLTLKGFVIINWTLEQLDAFFNATEFTRQWYQPLLCDLHSADFNWYEQQLMGIPHVGGKTATARQFTPILGPGMILPLIRDNLPLKQKVWQSLQYFADRQQLPVHLCRVLAPLIRNVRNTDAGIVPDGLEGYVTATLRKTASAENDPELTTLFETIRELIGPDPTETVDCDDTQRPQPFLKSLLQPLDEKPVYEESDLRMLEQYKSQLSYAEILHIMPKIILSVDKTRQFDWYCVLEEKRQKALQENPLQIAFWL